MLTVTAIARFRIYNDPNQRWVNMPSDTKVQNSFDSVQNQKLWTLTVVNHQINILERELNQLMILRYEKKIYFVLFWSFKDVYNLSCLCIFVWQGWPVIFHRQCWEGTHAQVANIITIGVVHYLKRTLKRVVGEQGRSIFLEICF